MSIVTGVMLICELSDWNDRPSDQVQEILDWLEARQERPWYWILKELAGHGGGSKHPQFEAWCGGFNLFGEHEDEFAQFVITREWDCPENTVLVIESEARDGETRVYRPLLNARQAA